MSPYLLTGLVFLNEVEGEKVADCLQNISL